jgi:hypothetical protein
MRCLREGVVVEMVRNSASEVTCGSKCMAAGMPVLAFSVLSLLPFVTRRFPITAVDGLARLMRCEWSGTRRIWPVRVQRE